MSAFYPSPLSTFVVNTTNNTTVSQNLLSFNTFTGSSGPSVINITVSAVATSGLANGSVGLASLSRCFKYNAISNTATAMTDLVGLQPYSGLIVLNIAPLFGDLLMLGCNVAINTASGSVSADLTGLNSTNITWNVVLNTFIT